RDFHVTGVQTCALPIFTKPHNRQILSARVRSLLRLKAATDALDDSYRKLRELEKVRDDLMKMIVHDLKTPLTSVLAALEMVMDGDYGPISDEQRRALGDAEAKAEDLLALIEDLLEVARIEETTLALDLTTLAPAAFLHEMVHEWALRCEQEGAEASVDCDDGAPACQRAHAMPARVFGTPIQTAAAHRARRVRLALAARREGDDRMLFTVADTGPGNPRE